MIRFLAIVVAVALIGYPLSLLYEMSVPVPEFRTGTYVDVLSFAGGVVIIYGGVLAGVAVHWVRIGRAWQELRPFEAFKAGVWGASAFGGVFVLGSGLRSLAAQGSFEKGIGNLWPLVLIFVVLLSAIVSGGMALLLYGFRPLKQPSASATN